MPNIFVFRPADGNETSGSYAVALEAKETPSVLALSRQNLPNIPGSSLDAVANGAYIIQVHALSTPYSLLVLNVYLFRLFFLSISYPSLPVPILLVCLVQAADGEGKPDVAFAATGSEVSICCEAAKALNAEGIRAQVISMPCWKLFEAQSTEYKQSVFTPGVPVLGTCILSYALLLSLGCVTRDQEGRFVCLYLLHFLSDCLLMYYYLY